MLDNVSAVIHKTRQISGTPYDDLLADSVRLLEDLYSYLAAGKIDLSRVRRSLSALFKIISEDTRFLDSPEGEELIELSNGIRDFAENMSTDANNKNK